MRFNGPDPLITPNQETGHVSDSMRPSWGSTPASARLPRGLLEIAGDVDEEVGAAGEHVALDADRSGGAQGDDCVVCSDGSPAEVDRARRRHGQSGRKDAEVADIGRRNDREIES